MAPILRRGDRIHIAYCTGNSSKAEADAIGTQIRADLEQIYGPRGVEIELLTLTSGLHPPTIVAVFRDDEPEQVAVQ